MLKKVLFKISYVSAGNGFNALLGFFFLTAVAREVTVEQFGKYALLTSILVALSKVMDFGTNSNYVAKSIATAKDLKDDFVSLKVFLFITASILAICILLAFKITEPTILITFFIGLVGYCINSTLFPFFHKLERFGLALSLNSIPAAIKGLVALLIYLKILTLDFNQLFMVFCFAMLFSVILFWALPTDLRSFKITFKHLARYLKETAPAGIALVVNNGWSAVANTLAKIIRGYADVGVFSLADKMSNVFNLISVSIFTVLLPKSSKRKRENLKHDVFEILFLSAAIMTTAIIVSTIAPVFIRLTFANKYNASIGLLTTMIFASAIISIQSFMENYFFAENKTPLLAKIAVFKIILLVGLFGAFVSSFGIYGLALAELFAAIAGLFLTIYAIRSVF